jgi:hypothetical protein
MQMATIWATPKLLADAAKDHANRQMRAAGRTIWNDEDYKLASNTYSRLMFNHDYLTKEEYELSLI